MVSLYLDVAYSALDSSTNGKYKDLHAVWARHCKSVRASWSTCEIFVLCIISVETNALPSSFHLGYKTAELDFR